jgi:hypothetical protein
MSDGKSITYKTVNGGGLRILGGTTKDVATIRAVDANGNTLSDILQVDTTNGKIVGGVLAKGVKKIWENGNPTSIFDSQRITEDYLSEKLENLIAIWVQFRFDTGDDTRYGLYIPIDPDRKNKGVRANIIVGVQSVASTYTRAVVAWEKDVEFGNAFQFGNTEKVNTFAIPIAIYGIK